VARWTDIRVGQVWRSKDRRDHGLTRTVIEAPASQAGTLVVTSGVRRSTMRPSTLLSRYELVSDTGAEEASRG
jgi:hypothetical protein